MTMKSSIIFLGLTFMLSSIAWTQEQDAEADIETVYIVQPKAMILRNRFEIIGQAAHDLADRYISQSGVSAQIIYHVRENFALALHGTWMFWQGNSSITDNLSALRNADGNTVLSPEGAPVVFVAPRARYFRKPWLASAEVQWSPLYGKISFQDWTLGLFQFFITAGAGVTTLEIRDIFNNGAEVPLPSYWSFATTIGGGFRIYFADHFGVRIEIKDFIQPMVARSDLPFSKPDPKFQEPSSFYLSHSPLLQAGISYVF